MANLFLRFPSVANAPDQDARIAAYVSDLVGFPIWAVQKAVYGATGQFVPSSSQLVEAAQHAVKPVKDEQASIFRVLSAETVGEQGRLASIDEGFEELRRSLYGKDGRETAKMARDNAERALAKMLIEKPPTPPMSDTLRALVAYQMQGAT